MTWPWAIIIAAFLLSGAGEVIAALVGAVLIALVISCMEAVDKIKGWVKRNDNRASRE